jgi:membrane protein
LGTKLKRIGIYVFPWLSLFIYFLLPVNDYPWYFRAAMLANFFFGMGMIARIHKHYTVDQLIASHSIGYLLLLLFVAMVVIDVQIIHNKGVFPRTFSCYPFFIVEAFVSVPLLIWLSARWRRFNRLILFVGVNSLLYYFFQRQAYLAMHKLLGFIGMTEASLLGAIFETVGTILILILPVLAVNKWMPFMSGKLRIKF